MSSEQYTYLVWTRYQDFMLSEQVIKLSEQDIKLLQKLKNKINMSLPGFRIYVTMSQVLEQIW